MSGTTGGANEANALDASAANLRTEADKITAVARTIRGTATGQPPPPAPPAPTASLEFTLDSNVVGVRAVSARISGIAEVGWIVYQNNPPSNTPRPGSELRRQPVPAGGEMRFNITLSEPGDRLCMFSEPDFAHVQYSEFAVAGDPAAPPQLPVAQSIDFTVSSLQVGRRTAVVRAVGVPSIGYVVFQNNHPYYSWRETSEVRDVAVPPSGEVTFSFDFVSPDDRLKVFSEPDLALFKNSEFAVAAGSTPTPVEPPPTDPNRPPVVAGVFRENFDGAGTGQMTHVWGDKAQVSVAGGRCRIGGTSGGAGVMQTIPSGRDVGFGYGRFKMRAKFTGSNGPGVRGDRGDGSGPAILAWPSDNEWPGPEIDFGEIGFGEELYFCHHHRDENNNNQDQYVITRGLDWWNWHDYSFTYQENKVVFEVDGVAQGVITEHVVPDFARGGQNRVLGFMNRSSNTAIDIEYVEWTPEHIMLEQAKEPPPESAPPSAPPTITVSVDSLIVGARTATARISGVTHVGYAVVQDDAALTWRDAGQRNVPVPANGILVFPVTLVAARDRVHVFNEPLGSIKAYSDYAQPAPSSVPSIGAVTLDSLVVGARNATVRIANIAKVGYTVFENNPPQYNWRTATTTRNVTVPAGGLLTFPITLTAAGDRVKVFSEPDAALYSDSDFAKSGTAPTPAVNQAWALYNKMGLGWNQERFTVPNHDTLNPAYWQYFTNTLGLKQCRMFFPFNPYREHFSDGSEGRIRRWIDAARAAINAGVPVVTLDAVDVLGDWDMDNNFIQRINEHMETFGRLVAEYSLPNDRFIIGAVNEYGAGNNAFWQPHRIRWNNTLRRHLPGTTVLEGPAYWKSCEALFNPGFKDMGAFVPWSDTNKIFSGHHYLNWDLGGMVWIAQEMRRFGLNNGNTPVVSGEWGFSSEYAGADFTHDVEEWKRRFWEHSGNLDIAKIKPFLWAWTDGGNWRINNYGTNAVRGDLGQGTVQSWASRVNGLLGL